MTTSHHHAVANGANSAQLPNDIVLQTDSAGAHMMDTGVDSQAKAFVEHKHESNMANLAAALNSERWTQSCDVSTERQASLTRLCSGRAILSYTFGGNTPSSSSTTTTTANT
eukprot:scaffold41643_cov62-Attheya_sp.AAC.2